MGSVAYSVFLFVSKWCPLNSASVVAELEHSICMANYQL